MMRLVDVKWNLRNGVGLLVSVFIIWSPLFTRIPRYIFQNFTNQQNNKTITPQSNPIDQLTIWPDEMRLNVKFIELLGATVHKTLGATIHRTLRGNSSKNF